MTVYSINTRAIEQSTNATPTAATSGKSSEDAAAEFTNVLQQAASSLFAGGSATRSPNTEAAFKSHFDRKAEQAEQSQTAEPTQRATDKTVARGRGRDDDKSAPRNDKVKAKDERKDDKAAAADGADKAVEAKPADQGDDAAATNTDDGANQQNTAEASTETVAVADQQVQPQAVAQALPLPQQQAQQTETVTVGAEEAAAQATQADDGKAPVQQAATQQTQGAQQAQTGEQEADAGNDDGADFTDMLAANTAQGDAAAGAQKHTARKADTAAQAQADQLAQSLDDTGAQLNIQVQVSNTAEAKSQTAAATTTTVEAPVVQQAAAVVAPTDTASGDAATGQNAGQATAAQPTNAQANTAQTANAQQSGQAFDAILAAQAEATTGQKVDAGAGQSQNNQPVAALTGVGATTAAQKAQAPQAAQAARQPQLPQSKEVMEQVSVQIAKQSKDGTDTIKVQLKPVELGTIEIKMDVAKDGTVTTVVTADNKDTLELLKKDQSSLQKALTDAGLKSDTGSMTFNLREGNQQQAQQQQQQNGGNVGRRRARLEAAAAADAASARAAAAAQARWGVGRSGVDIQV